MTLALFTCFMASVPRNSNFDSLQTNSFIETISIHRYFVGVTTVVSGLSYVVKGSQTFRILK